MTFLSLILANSNVQLQHQRPDIVKLDLIFVSGVLGAAVINDVFLCQNVGMTGTEMRVLSAKELIQVLFALCLIAL